MLCLIIFLWTPPHFWALALYRAEDYRTRRPADAAGDARRRVHAAARAAVHAACCSPRTLLPFVYRHERLDLPGGRGRARRGVHAATRGACGAATATRWRAGPSASRSVHLSLLFAALLVDHYLLTAGSHDDTSRLRRARRCCARSLLAGCDRHRRHRREADFKSIDITGAEYARELRAARPRRQAAHAGRLQGQGRWWCSSATPSAPTCARPRWPSWRRSKRRWARTASACRACSSRSTPSATRPRC